MLTSILTRIVITFFIDSFSNLGKHTAYGGASTAEPGGAGTIYIQHGNDTNSKHSKHLIIDNRNQQPKNVYLSNANQTFNNTGKTWLIVSKNTEVSLSKLMLKGRAHLAVHRTNLPFVNIKTKLFEGDFSGQIHVPEKVNLTVKQSSIFFPASFRVYDGGHIGLPEKITLDSFANKDVSIDGTISGVKDLTVSSGVRLVFGDKVTFIVASYLVLWVKVNFGKQNDLVFQSLSELRASGIDFKFHVIFCLRNSRLLCLWHIKG